MCAGHRLRDRHPQLLHRRCHRCSHSSLLLAALCVCLGATAAPAAVNVITYAPGTETAAIAGRVIEDFEDVALQPGFSITLSTWRNSVNAVTADPPVTYSGTLPSVWAPSSIGYPLNAWDGTHAFVNGAAFTWAYPYAATMTFTFDPPLADVGFGLSNIQHDAGSGLTNHTVKVNGVSVGTLESMPHWVSSVPGKNLYLLVAGDADTPIQSVVITADTHFDGMVVDKMALGSLAVPESGTTWGEVKSLFR